MSDSMKNHPTDYPAILTAQERKEKLIRAGANAAMYAVNAVFGDGEHKRPEVPTTRGELEDVYAWWVGCSGVIHGAMLANLGPEITAGLLRTTADELNPAVGLANEFLSKVKLGG